MTVTVRPLVPSPGFSQLIALVFAGQDRFSVALMDTGVLLGCVWDPDLVEAAQRIQAAFSSEVRWTEPQINYVREVVATSTGQTLVRILEPILEVEVHTPDDFSGTVLGDLSSRRGMIKGMDDDPVGKKIYATVPLSELRGYVAALSRATRGLGTATAEFDSYGEAPKTIGPDPDEPMSATLRA